MQALQNAESLLGIFVLLDPKAWRVEWIEFNDFENILYEAAQEGGVVGYSTGCSESSMRILLLVDEAIPERLLERRRQSFMIDDGYLSVPAGNLVFTAFDDLYQLGQPAYPVDQFKPHSGHSHEISPGHYRVEAFEIDWGDEYQKEYAARVNPADERVDTLIGVSIGCVFLFTIFLLPILFIVIWIVGDLSHSLWFLLYVVIFEIIFWVSIHIILGRSQAGDRIDAVRKELEPKYPDAVVRLTRIDSSPDSFSPGFFGEELIEIFNDKKLDPNR